AKSLAGTGSSSVKGSQERRKTLQVLQPSANGNGHLVGSGGPIRRQGSSYQPTGTPGRMCVMEREVREGEPAPEKYWQLLAEERRIALHEALEENQKLCKELEKLKERCTKLEEVAGQAEYFASLYS
ncbi:hypothetical protein QZH41_019147, partial [Actinostola sp. cb2023]